jgi:putative lipoprotein
MLGDAESGAMFAFGCHPGVLESTSMLEGTVTYRTRQALPAGAVVEVRLVDVSRADAPSVTHARQVLVTGGEQVPIPFALTYAPEVIEPGHRYQVQATITIDGRVRFRTTTAHPVLASDAAGPVVITVQPSR